MRIEMNRSTLTKNTGSGLVIRAPFVPVIAVTLLLFTVSLPGSDSRTQELIHHSELKRESDKQSYERQRAAAHRRMPSTLYASNPSPPASPHTAEPIHNVSNGIDPERHLQILEAAYSRRSASDSDDEETAESVFTEFISPIVQDKCMACHFEGGIYERDRLVFVGSSNDDHESHNFQVFKEFVTEVDDGDTIILSKIRGGLNHFGRDPVPEDSVNYPHFERFIQLLLDEEESGDGTVTWRTLFDNVGMRSDRKVLRQAAVIFAGRIPTEEEYASISEIGLRKGIRNLMVGPGFHEFLIRAANDRLFTDREDRVISGNANEPFVDYVSVRTSHCEAIARGVTDAEQHAMDEWNRAVSFATVRAPLELIAHVVENDLPYTEILTADYVMANPQAAQAYGADTEFDDAENPFMFEPSRFAKYFLRDHTREFGEQLAGTNCEPPITYPGDSKLVYPHAGVLNSPVFMVRYPTTDTNRNRARSRWTYYHFLGFDIEKSASRTIDPVALADTNNPTYNNSACTVCHTVLDPVAGTFQNYGDEGRYRPHDRGSNALDDFYKRDPAGGEDFFIEARSYDDRETFSSRGFLPVGESTIAFRNDRYRGNSNIGIERIELRDSKGRRIQDLTFDDLINTHCGHLDHFGFELGDDCILGIPVRVPAAGIYEIEFTAWKLNEDDTYPNRLRVWVPGYIFRDGDTWYRDMREPGIGNRKAPNADNSVQWLAQQIIADDRFAEATVKFWWPALHGVEVINEPAHTSDAVYAGLQLAAVAQDEEVKRLARAFRTGIGDGDPYIVKDLLVEMVLSPWFRAETRSAQNDALDTALLYAGAKRLLTPEELALKTLTLTGVQWGREHRQPWHHLKTRLHGLGNDYNILYGGIDSDGNIDRVRDMTAVMASVAKSHAIELSCPIVLRDMFLVRDGERLLFNGADHSVYPTSEFSLQTEVTAESYERRAAKLLSGPLTAGKVSVNMYFTNDYWGGSAETDRNLYISLVRIRDEDNELVGVVEPEDFIATDCGSLGSVNTGSGQKSYYGLYSSNCEPLIAEFDIPADGNYTIHVVAWAKQAGDEKARLAFDVESDMERSAGSHAIKAKLAELYSVLLGESLSLESEELNDTYDVFVEVWNREKTQHRSELTSAISCAWAHDFYFLEGLTNDHIYQESDGVMHWDWETADSFVNEYDLSDPNAVGRTWVVMLSAFLSDPRYLHL